jgi:hypothetical protein
LSDFGVSVSLNGQTVDPSKTTAVSLEIYETYTVEITAPATAEMKGCFVRFGAQTSKDVLLVQPGENVAIASACDGITNAVGLSHFDDQIKTICSGDIVVLAKEAILIEVTIVVSNSLLGPSIFAYDSFSTEAVEAVPGGSPTVTDNATGQPTTTPGDSPMSPVVVDSPTEAPFMDPGQPTVVMPPGVAPTVVAPTGSEVPVNDPVKSPTSVAASASTVSLMIGTLFSLLLL